MLLGISPELIFKKGESRRRILELLETKKES